MTELQKLYQRAESTICELSNILADIREKAPSADFSVCILSDIHKLEVIQDHTEEAKREVDSAGY